MSLRREAWLILRNDFRLMRREVRAGKLQAFSSSTFMVIALVALQVLMVVAFTALGHPPPLGAEAIVWFFLGFVMLGAAMNHAVTVLFERADFDLLLSSPVSPGAILLARLCGMTAAAGLAVGLFLIPMLNGAAIGISSRYLFGYVVWLFLATIVTCCGVWFTLVLVRWLGARRARTWAQVIAAVLGATVYIIFQLQNALESHTRNAVALTIARLFEHPVFTLLARAGHGQIFPLLTLFALAATTALITTRVLGRVFVTGIQDAAVVRVRHKRRRKFQFTDGLVRATFRKDVRLIVRDPLLLSRVLPSVFYLAPVLFPLHRAGHAGAVGLLAPFAIITAVMLSSQLTAVAAAGEEGWDLIRLSPASTVTLRIAKIGAGMALPMIIVVAIALIVIALGRPAVALVVLVTASLSSVGTCWIEVAAMRPTPRKDLIQRSAGVRRPITVSRALGGIGFLGAGAAAAVLAANALWWWTGLAVGMVALFTIGCCTLVEMRDIEFEAATAPAK